MVFGIDMSQFCARKRILYFSVAKIKGQKSEMGGKGAHFYWRVYIGGKRVFIVFAWTEKLEGNKEN